jgi:hypothetical protein
MSGLLPRNPGPPTSGAGFGFFSSLTVGSLVVEALASIATLVVGGAASVAGVLSAPGSVWSDIYANYTAGNTVTLETRSANANVRLSPNGTGQVVVSSGTTLTADAWASTTPTTNLHITPTGTFVAVASGKELTVDTIGTTSASTSLALSPTGTSVVVASGIILTADTLSPTTAATPLTLTAASNQNIDITPVGTGKAIIAAGKTLTADTIASTTASTSLALSPTGTAVVVASGKTLSADTIASTTASTSLALSPTGTAVVVASGKTLEADIWASTTASTSLQINPTGAFVTIAAGKSLSVDTIGTTSAGALALVTTSGQNITLTPGGAGVVTIGGAAAADTSSKILALGAGNAVVYQDTLSGQFSATWTPVTGFSGTVTAILNYMRLGNVVTCSGSVANVTTSVGANTANLSLPIARSAVFAANIGAAGSFIWSSTLGLPTSAELIANTATTNEIVVGFASTAALTSTTIYLSFQYQLVL